MSQEKSPIKRFEGAGGARHEVHSSKSRELEKNRHEKASEALKNRHEKASEALHKIAKEAISGKEYAPKQGENKSQVHSTTRQQEKDISFQTTMNHVQRNLSKQERAFSRIIHQPVVEKVSDVASKTIARPSGIAGGTIAAFIGLIFVYGIARFAGFSLSGSEMPIFLVSGFALGLFLEWAIKSVQSIFARSSTK